VEQMRLKHGFDARLTSTGSPRQLPEAHQVFLYQAARELLANSAAHSGAPGAAISLEWADREVRLTVADAGRGLDPSAPQILQPDHGFGLFSIRERLKDMGGTMTLTGAPGAGCAVALRVPTLASTSP
jgi:signal transduction histidine kinase